MKRDSLLAALDALAAENAQLRWSAEAAWREYDRLRADLEGLTQYAARVERERSEARRERDA